MYKIALLSVAVLMIGSASATSTGSPEQLDKSDPLVRFFDLKTSFPNSS